MAWECLKKLFPKAKALHFTAVLLSLKTYFIISLITVYLLYPVQLQPVLLAVSFYLMS